MKYTDVLELQKSLGELDTPTQEAGGELGTDAGAMSAAVDGASDIGHLSACGAATDIDNLLISKRAAAGLFRGADAVLSLPWIFGVEGDLVISRT